MTFSENLKQIRINKGFSQKEIAERLGVSQPSYAQYENGKRNPKLETVRKIADALGVYISDLIVDWKQYGSSEYAQDIINDITQDVISSAEEAVFSGKEVMRDLKETFIISDFRKLNKEGQDKAIEQVELLTKIPEYRKDTEE